MAKDRQPSPRDSASEAMQRALAAEAEAREAIEGCQAQAESLREQARTDANRILERADRRVEWVHDHCNRVLEQGLAELQASEAPAAATAWADDATLEAAAEALAQTLTSPEDRGGADEGRQG
jgi:vacuolar-type H+-ATPase subunit H